MDEQEEKRKNCYLYLAGLTTGVVLMGNGRFRLLCFWTITRGPLPPSSLPDIQIYSSNSQTVINHSSRFLAATAFIVSLIDLISIPVKLRYLRSLAGSLRPFFIPKEVDFFSPKTIIRMWLTPVSFFHPLPPPPTPKK